MVASIQYATQFTGGRSILAKGTKTRSFLKSNRRSSILIHSIFCNFKTVVWFVYYVPLTASYGEVLIFAVIFYSTLRNTICI